MLRQRRGPNRRATRLTTSGDRSNLIHRSHARSPRQLAEESVVLVANSGVLPLRRGTRIALVGPRADDAFAMLGCYTFPSHVGLQYPKWPLGLSIPTLLEATRDELPDADVTFTAGCDVDGTNVDGFAAATSAASAADVCVVAPRR